MTNTQSDDVLPHAYGNEFESAIMLATKGDDGEWCPVPEHRVPHELLRHVPERPPGVSGGFLQNGYRAYVDDAHLEVCTPEAASPSGVAAAIRGTDLLIEQTVRRYLADSPERVHHMARLQKRVVDSNGVRWGSHDNFDISSRLAAQLERPNSPERRALLVHLMTRSAVVGAGYIGPRGMRFAQKIDGLMVISGHLHNGSMFRLARDAGLETRARLEVRCGDANVSDWATWMRFGSAALLLALLELGEVSQFVREDLLDHERDILKGAMTRNAISADETHRLAADHLGSSLGFQRSIAEAALHRLPAVADASSEYYRVAEELLAFCDDMERVRRRGAEVLSLADRADWPIKLHAIQAAFAKNPRLSQRDPGTVWKTLAEVLDRRYDETRIVSYGGVVVEEQYGWGLRRRDEGAYRLQVPLARAKAYSYFPEPGTRAAVRAGLMRRYVIGQCDWDRIAVQAVGVREIPILLRDVRQSQLDEMQVQALSMAERRF